MILIIFTFRNWTDRLLIWDRQPTVFNELTIDSSRLLADFEVFYRQFSAQNDHKGQLDEWMSDWKTTEDWLEDQFFMVFQSLIHSSKQPLGLSVAQKSLVCSNFFYKDPHFFKRFFFEFSSLAILHYLIGE